MASGVVTAATISAVTTIVGVGPVGAAHGSTTMPI